LLPRCSQPLSTNQTPHPTTKTSGRQPPTPNQGADPTPRVTTISGFPHSGRRDSGPVVSKPNSVSGSPSPHAPPPKSRGRPVPVQHVCRAPAGHPLQGPAPISPPQLIPHDAGAEEKNGAP